MCAYIYIHYIICGVYIFGGAFRRLGYHYPQTVDFIYNAIVMKKIKSLRLVMVFRVTIATVLEITNYLCIFIAKCIERYILL